MSSTANIDGQYECVTCGDRLDIISILSHDCDVMLAAADLSRDERNTLMYIEARMVDYKGELDPEQMNYEDYQNLKLFAAVGMIEVEEASGSSIHGLHHMDRVTKFDDRAWDLARDCRQLRAADWIDHEVDLGRLS